jgi:hypothetical protein
VGSNPAGRTNKINLLEYSNAFTTAKLGDGLLTRQSISPDPDIFFR